MATIPQMTTTAAQDLVIQRELNKVNAANAAKIPPVAAMTIPQYVTSILVSAFNGWKAQQAREDTDGLKTAWEAATPAQRTAARTALGL